MKDAAQAAPVCRCLHTFLLCVAALGRLPLGRAQKLNGSYGVQEETSKPAGWRPHPYCTAVPPERQGDVHLSPRCGTWQRDYARMHAAGRTGNASAKFLVYSCDLRRQPGCGGLGDRMLGMLTTFMIATLTGRVFLSDQPPDFERVYEPVAINWRMPRRFPLLPAAHNPKGPCSLAYTKRRRAPRPGDVVDLFAHDKNFRIEHFYQCFRQLGAVRTVVLRFNRGLTVGGVRSPGEWGQRLRTWGLREPYITGCMLRYLLRPRKDIEDSVKSIVEELRAPGTFSVCIHSRPGGFGDSDRALGLGSSAAHSKQQLEQTEHLVRCAKELSEYWSNGRQTVKWFLMAASFAAKEHVKRRDPDKVVITDWVPLHSEPWRNPSPSAKQGDAFLLAGKEWTVFTKCSLFVFHDSGLSKTAALYAMRPQSMYLFPRLRDVDERSARLYCDPGAPTPVRSLASSLWSGA